MPISHVSLPTGQEQYKAMRDFYVAILAPLGYIIFMEKEGEVLGMGPKNANPDFWLHCGHTDFKPFDGNLDKRAGKTHVAFQATSQKAVDDWFKTAIKAGGVDNGKPGERPYVKGYYAAFVIDPLGNNIELVHFSPLWLKALESLPFVATALVGAGAAIAAAKLLG